jgi:hypothetical protein
MTKKIGKILAVVLVIAVVISMVAIYYFNFSVKGTFNVTITDKNNKESLANPFLPLNTFEAGETITLSIWVSGNTNPFLTNQISLWANGNGNAINYYFTDILGNNISYVTIPSGVSGYSCFLKIETTPTGFLPNGNYQYGTSQGNYTVTVFGADEYNEHQDSYSFSIVNAK